MVTLGDLGNKKWLTLERRTERSPKKQEKRVTLKTRNKGLPWKQEIKDYICNKRAQRALGRSPEEKVKGHSGAYNREPQGHNLNNFGRGPFDDVIYKK